MSPVTDPDPTSDVSPSKAARRARGVRLAAIVLVVLAAAVPMARVVGPSGLYQNTDECKTIACTADVAIEGRWALPRDSKGVPNRKPPLFNWIGAPVVAAGFYDEWAYKVPSILSGLAMAAVCVWMAGRMLGRVGDEGGHRDDPGIGAGAVGFAIAAGAVWLSTPASVKYSYFGRQDMLFAACLCAGWACMTAALEREGRRRLLLAACGWGCAILAGLTKGPLALMIPIYVLAASLLIHRSFRPFLRSGWWWGVPLVVGVPFLWVWAAYGQDPEFVGGELLGKELVGRMERGTGTEPLRMLHALWGVPAHVVERFAPWGALTLAAFVLVPPRRWFGHPLAPAFVWMLAWYVVLIIFAGSAGSFLLPMAGAVCVLATYAAARFSSLWSWSGAHLAVVAVVVGAGSVAYEVGMSRGARSGLGDRIAAFAREARAVTRGDSVVFVGTGHNPVSTLMGRHQAGEATPEMIEGAAWVVTFVLEDGPEPALSTEALVRLRLEMEDAYDREAGLALYRGGEYRASVEDPGDRTGELD